ncbi:unnamed protein product [Ectocarpus sp. 6 AP-2014]
MNVCYDGVCVWIQSNTNEHAYPVAIHSIPTGRDVGSRRGLSGRMLSRLCHKATMRGCRSVTGYAAPSTKSNNSLSRRS